MIHFNDVKARAEAFVEEKKTNNNLSKYFLVNDTRFLEKTYACYAELCRTDFRETNYVFVMFNKPNYPKYHVMPIDYEASRELVDYFLNHCPAYSHMCCYRDIDWTINNGLIIEVGNNYTKHVVSLMVAFRHLFEDNKITEAFVKFKQFGFEPDAAFILANFFNWSLDGFVYVSRNSGHSTFYSNTFSEASFKNFVTNNPQKHTYFKDSVQYGTYTDAFCKPVCKEEKWLPQFFKQFQQQTVHSTYNNPFKKSFDALRVYKTNLNTVIFPTDKLDTLRAYFNNKVKEFKNA